MDGDRSLRSGERSSSSKVRPQPRSLETLVKMELVWNRQRGGKGSLRVGEVVDALAGPQSQVNCLYLGGQGRVVLFFLYLPSF